MMNLFTVSEHISFCMNKNLSHASNLNPMIIRYPSSVVCHPSSVVSHPPSVLRHKSSVIRHPVCIIKKGIYGFTLIEILIAFFIFSIIVTTLFISYNSVFSNIQTIHEGIASYDMAKNCLARMTFDLHAVHISMPPKYSPPDLDDKPDPYRIVGDFTYPGGVGFSRLRFTSLAHIYLEKNMQEGIAEIVYYIQSEGEHNYVLRRADSLYPYKAFEENRKDPILCEDVKSLTFKYYDHDGVEYDLWDSESEEFKYATPKSIGIKLELGNDSTSHFFEIMVTLPSYRVQIG